MVWNKNMHLMINAECCMRFVQNLCHPLSILHVMSVLGYLPEQRRLAAPVIMPKALFFPVLIVGHYVDSGAQSVMA